MMEARPMELTLDEIKRGAKREDFRAGVQMRLLMPRLSVRVTRWVVSHTTLTPNQITIASFAVGLGAAVAFGSTDPLVVALGLVAFHLHVLLDYVDGEVARCRSLTSTRGAYFDLITDRVTFPLLVFCAGLGVYRQLGDPAALIVAFAATFGLLLDKEAVDCWYRANAGAPEVEDRYVVAPERSALRRWAGRLKLLAVMARGLTAFLTYTAAAALLDTAWPVRLAGVGSCRGFVLWLFAPLMLLGAVTRFLYIYQRGAIPRRQQLL
jgi:phosphatidylglycerophosphate synthase